MVVSDELPKASSKERGGGGKVNFFFENLSLVPETRQVMEHFKLVFGSGTSDLAKIRPLKNWPPPFPGSHRLLGTSIVVSFAFSEPDQTRPGYPFLGS